MLAKFAYYILVFPFSKLPLWALYLFTDFFYLLLISVVPYRRKLVKKHISKSFPALSKVEQKKLLLKFYRHLTDILAEGLKNLSISKKELNRRLTVVNKEVIDQFYTKGKSVLLVGAHYNNWEWVITSQNFLLEHQAVGIGMKMTSDFWDEKINARRSRFGMKVVHNENFRDELQKLGKSPYSLLVLADQSPSNTKKSYWADFLNQKTAFLFGTEMIANELDLPVVYIHLKKVKRGHYEISFETICENPRKMEYGQISDKHIAILERNILSAPEFWIWTHNRWKRELPESFETLRKTQYEKFKKRFNRS